MQYNGIIFKTHNGNYVDDGLSFFSRRSNFFKFINITLRLSHLRATLVLSLPNCCDIKLKVCTANSNDFFREAPIHKMLIAPPTILSTRRKSVPTLFCISNAIPLMRQSLKNTSSCVARSGECTASGINTAK